MPGHLNDYASRDAKESRTARLNEAMQRVYRPMLAWCLRHRWLTLGLVLAAFAGTGAIAARMPFQLGAPAKPFQLAVHYELSPGLTRAATRAQGDAIDARLRELLGDEKVKVTTLRVGSILDEETDVLSTGANLGHLRWELAYGSGKETFRVDVDQDRAALYGLTEREVALAVRTAVDGVVAAEVSIDEEPVDIVVRYAEGQTRARSGLRDLVIANAQGKAIRLDQVARVERTRDLGFVRREDGLRTGIVYADTDRDVLPPLQAAALEGAIGRLRAILATTLTTCLGLFPLAIGLGGRDEVLAPMAVSIAAGLGFATVLVLLVVPPLYLVLEDLRALPRRLFRGRAERPTDPGGSITAVTNAIAPDDPTPSDP